MCKEDGTVSHLTEHIVKSDEYSVFLLLLQSFSHIKKVCVRVFISSVLSAGPLLM